MNVPNILTLWRVIFAVAIFVLLPFKQYDLCLLLFILASLTDFADGWWARKFKQVTVFGRIMDPFADKLLICGVFICLLSVENISRAPDGLPGWLMLQPWMVVAIVARELLITSLRAFVEKSGGDFSAKWIGKWKMALQCLAIIAIFTYLTTQSDRSLVAETLGNLCGENRWQKPVFYLWIVSLWGTVVITLYSGVTYCINAARMIRAQS